ncbi:MAG TPA: hypothetical protein VF624_17405 [Tepidisphaeraceae bacterium]
MRRPLVLIFALLCACDAGPPAGPAAGPARRVIEWRTLATLRAGRETTVISRPGGGAYVFQADGDGRVRAVSGAGEVTTLPVSPQRLAAALGATGEDDAAAVRLAAIAVLPRGDLVLQTAGASRKRSLVSLQRYDPASDRLTLLMSAAEMASASGMGDSIDVADAQLAGSGAVVWLWLRTTDGSVMLQFEARQLASGTARAVRPFRFMRQGDQPLRPGDATTLCGRPGGGFWLLDRAAGLLWSLDGTGRATPVDPPDGRPAPSAPPLLLETAGAPRMTFYPAPRPSDAAITPTSKARYPLLEIVAGRSKATFDRDALAARPAFPLHALRVTAWARDTRSGDVFAYDRMSGELLRLTPPSARADPSGAGRR